MYNTAAVPMRIRDTERFTGIACSSLRSRHGSSSDREKRRSSGRRTRPPEHTKPLDTLHERQLPAAPAASLLTHTQGHSTPNLRSLHACSCCCLTEYFTSVMPLKLAMLEQPSGARTHNEQSVQWQRCMAVRAGAMHLIMFRTSTESRPWPLLHRT